MTHYLTSQQVLFIHARLIATTGGEHGVRDVGLLASAIARPQATFDGADLYLDLFQKAAALMASLTQNHPFVFAGVPHGSTAHQACPELAEGMNENDATSFHSYPCSFLSVFP